MIQQYVYSITIQKENETISFLKSFNSLIKINNKLVNKSNRSAVNESPNGVETFSFIGSNATLTHQEMYEWWCRLSLQYNLSVEYVKDGYVWLLGIRAPQKSNNQVIIHNRVPMIRRGRRKFGRDLRLRLATEKDYGCGEIEEITNTKSLVEELKDPKWLLNWNQRYSYLARCFKDCNGAVEHQTARQLLILAFAMTVAEISQEQEVPDYVYHLIAESGSCTGVPKPCFILVGMTRVRPSSQQYKVYLESFLNGKIWGYVPSFYSRFSGEELYNLYYEVIGTYSKIYPTP